MATGARPSAISASSLPQPQVTILKGGLLNHCLATSMVDHTGQISENLAHDWLKPLRKFTVR